MVVLTVTIIFIILYFALILALSQAVFAEEPGNMKAAFQYEGAHNYFQLL